MPDRPVLSARRYTLGPLVSIGAALALAVFGLEEYLWLPLGALALYWLSLVSVMWETARSPRRRTTPAVAVALLVVPGLHLVGPLWTFGGFPAALDKAAREHGLDEPRLSRGTFVGFALAWMLLAAAGTYVLAAHPDDLVVLEIVLPPTFVWLPLSLAVTWQTSRAVNAVAAGRAPADRVDDAAAAWRRDRAAVLEARKRHDPVERAWADDMLRRYAERGVAEARELSGDVPSAVQVGRLPGPFRVPVVIGLVRVRAAGRPEHSE